MRAKCDLNIRTNDSIGMKISVDWHNLFRSHSLDSLGAIQLQTLELTPNPPPL